MTFFLSMSNFIFNLDYGNTVVDHDVYHETKGSIAYNTRVKCNACHENYSYGKTSEYFWQ